MSARVGEPLDLSGVEIVPISTVRAWAHEQGIFHGRRGHLPGYVIDQFNRRHRRKRALNTNPAVKA